MMNNKIAYSFLLLAINIQPVFGYFPIHGLRPALYSLIILYTIIFFANNRLCFQYIVSNKLFLTYALLLAYHCINCYFQNVPIERETSGGYVAFFIQFFPNFCVMCLAYVLLLVDIEKTIKILFWGFSLYMVLAFGLVEPEEGTGRLISTDIHPNQFAQCAGIALLIGLLYKEYKTSSRLLSLLIWGLPILSILGCGSRNGLSLLFICFAAFLFSKFLNGTVSMSKILTFITGAFVLFFITLFIINETDAGQRMVEMQSKTSELEIQTGTILDILGERSIYYYYGWYNFLDSPIFGIGLRNFEYYNNYNHPLHSEYMIHLCEGGLIGFCLYIIFLFGIIKGLKYRWSMGVHSKGIIIFFMFFSYLFVGVTAREMYYPCFFVLLAIIMAYGDKNNFQFNDI